MIQPQDEFYDRETGLPFRFKGGRRLYAVSLYGDIAKLGGYLYTPQVLTEGYKYDNGLIFDDNTGTCAYPILPLTQEEIDLAAITGYKDEALANLKELDNQLSRSDEDLIDLLVSKGIISLDELNENTRDKVNAKKAHRAEYTQASAVISDGDVDAQDKTDVEGTGNLGTKVWALLNTKIWG